jgi:hypothetical protein
VIDDAWRSESGNEAGKQWRHMLNKVTYRHPISLHETKLLFVGAEPALRPEHVCVRTEN